MPRIKHALLAAAIIAALAVFGAACDGDDDSAESSNAASQSSIDALSARLQATEQVYGILTLDSLGLHDMAETLSSGTIDASFSTKTRTAIRVLALTDWDASIAADARAVHDHAVDLLEALNGEDVGAASAAAAALHDGEHDWSEKVWAIVAKDLPPDAGGVEAHDEDPANETPGAEDDDDHGEAGDAPAGEATP